MSTKVDQIFVRDPASPAQRARTQYVTLKTGERVGVRTQYVTRSNKWALWILALDGSVVCGPVLLVRGFSLLTPYQYDARVPQGQLWVSGEDMTLTTTDVRAKLLYRGAS